MENKLAAGAPGASEPVRPVKVTRRPDAPPNPVVGDVWEMPVLNEPPAFLRWDGERWERLHDA